MHIIKKKDRMRDYIQKFQLQDYFSFNIEDDAKLIAYDMDEMIGYTNEKYEELLLLVEGECAAYSLNAKDQIHCERYYRPFDVMGLISVIWETSAINDIKALTPCVFISIPMDKYRRKLLEDIKFLRFSVKYLANHIRENSRLFEPLQPRLATHILEMEKEGYFYQNLALSADLLGTSYRHLLRTLKLFCDHGILYKERRGLYHIRDRNQLEEIKAGKIFDFENSEK